MVSYKETKEEKKKYRSETDRSIINFYNRLIILFYYTVEYVR